jgi:hypothetical protein
MKRKMVAWSYPTSENAAKFGASKTGCWTVDISEANKPPIAIKGFIDLESAREFCTTLDYPMSRYTY